MKKLTLLILVFFCLNFFSTAQTVSEQDSLALVALYDSTNGTGWYNNSGWLEPDVNISEWYGVTVENNRVTRIELKGDWNSKFGLQGEIPDVICNLTELDSLDLSFNSLTGQLPSEFWELTSLEYVNLGWGNQINGIIPYDIQKLTNLKYLDLSGNQFNDTLPASIGNLLNLEFLNLDDNELEGSIPTELGELKNLGMLNLGRNQLTGNIPEEIGNLTNLTQLHLYQNMLSDTIPSKIGNLINVFELNLADNQLTGYIPKEFVDLVNLDWLWLHNNQLYGTIPMELCNLPITQASFSNNYFDEQSCATIQCLLEDYVQFGDEEQIQKSGFSLINDCNLTSPENLRTQDSLALVALYENTEGPSWIENSGWLEEGVRIDNWFGVEVSNNRVISIQLGGNDEQMQPFGLDGFIPPEIGDLTELRHLNLRYNNLTDNIPTEIGKLVKLKSLYLGGNQLTGSIPKEIGQLTSLLTLDLIGNKLSGNIPTEIRELVNLQYVNIGWNQIEGDIPTGLENLTKLEVLYLRGNSFTGNIPNELGKLTNLRQLDLNWSNLTDTIPSGLAKLENLEWLTLGGNNLEGEIPIGFCNSKISFFDFGGNNFDASSCPTIKCLIDKGAEVEIGGGDSDQTQQSGFSLITDCNITETDYLYQDSLALVALYDSTNGTGWHNNSGWLEPGVNVSEWHGVHVDEGRVTTIDLMNNNLNGSLPDEFYNLTALVEVFFHGNPGLEGEISHLIGNLSQLHGFHSNETAFSGELPAEIVQCGNLNTLHIESNNFSGTIPSQLCEMPLEIVNFGHNFFEPSCDAIQCMVDNGVDFHGEVWQPQKSGISLFGECGIIPSVEPVLEQDSLALVALYDSTGGDFWNSNEYWKSEYPVALWQGVHVNEGRVTAIELWNNNMNGFIPDEFYNLTELVEFLFHDNPNLGGEISSSIGNLTQLDGIHCNGTNFTGLFPTEIEYCTNLHSIHIAGNQFSGSLPQAFCNLPVEIANFEQNNFDSGSCSAMQCLKDKGVDFHGDLWQRQKDGFSLFEGCELIPDAPPVPEQDSLALVAFYEATYGPNWHNNDYWKTDCPVALWHGVDVWDGRVRGLSFEDNNLNGELPEAFYNLTGLHHIYISNSPDLAGTISNSIGNLTELGFLELSGTSLEGSFPSSISNCTNLETIYIPSNNLSGQLPIEFCDLPIVESDFYWNYFDLESCETFKCLMNKDAIAGDSKQTQKNGYQFPDYCNPNVNRSLIITEARMDRQDMAYVELTNVGPEPLQLSEFEFGRITAWNLPWASEYNNSFLLPDKILQPGESFVIAAVYDFGPEQWLNDPDNYQEQETKADWLELADIQMHVPERNGDETDSISGDYWSTFDVWSGRDSWFIRHHVSNNEAVVVDQVGGVFDQEDGTNRDHGSFDVAGFSEATRTATLVRKADVSVGYIHFASGRGVGTDDSEWIALPHLYGEYEPWRDVFWTAGNHGDFNLDETTLVSNTLTVDWENKTITAPWGTRSLDDFMNEFEKKPGLAWHYFLSEEGDNIEYMSAQTGDSIRIYACGNDLEEETFRIIVSEPTPDANIVIPKYRPEGSDFMFGFGSDPRMGQVDWPRVTRNAAGIDTITGSHFGLPFATRTDSLLKYLEKAPNASWEFVFPDGYQRADLKTGDILKVTAENGEVKEYFIKVQGYRPSHEAELAAITWPDIPDELRGAEGWIGDTIPGFNTSLYEYTLTIPHYVPGIPALLPVPKDTKAKIVTEILNPQDGNVDNKTIVFTITAEDGYTQRIYRVNINKLKAPENIQEFNAEPFLSQLVFQDQWANGFIEICNPGNQQLNLSDYMFVFMYGGKEMSITEFSGPDNWPQRYRKYVPGYKWVDESSWIMNPGTLVPDPSVDSIVAPGDVFVAGQINSTDQSGFPWYASEQCDVIFDTEYNPWNEEYEEWGSAAHEWMGGDFYLYKIINDSIKQGLKPANDPADFELIEVFGMGDGSNWIVGGEEVQQITTYIRKPQYWQGKTQYSESFGTNPDDSEWIIQDLAYWQKLNVGWPNEILNISNDLGKHAFYEITDYQSVVYSNTYKVSPGYSWSETINGVLTGTSSAEFLSNIVKANEGQELAIVGLENDSFTGGEVLEVVSADGTNTTKYVIEVTTEGLSDDVILSSSVYDITFPADTAEITGFEFGTLLREVVDSVNLPEGATMIIIDDNQNFVPFERLNKQDQLVDVKVNAKTYFKVTAEDGQTKKVYRLVPVFPQEEIVASSELFYVNNEDSIISSIETTTTVSELLSNIYIEDGAIAIVIDKYGYEREYGPIYPDDRVVIIYDESSYYGLKALNSDPRTYKVYRIYMCETLPIVRTKDVTIELDANGYASISIDDIDNGSVNECGESWLTLSQTEFSCDDIGLNTVTLSMRNDVGGIAAQKTTVTIDDNISPVVVAEDVVDINSDGMCNKLTNNLLDYLQISDNCGIQSVTNDASGILPIGTTDVTWEVVDYGGNMVTAVQSVTINNLTPEIVEINAPSDPVEISNEINVSAVVVDNNLSSATWDWGDSSTSQGVLGDEILGTHYYSTPGVYTLTLTVEDKCGERDTLKHEYIVIYNPEGGFVTGGGWINSPAGASVEFPEATGKANFGFVSKYKKGANVPTGNTEFKFRAGNLSYKSSEYEWLVIAGAKAKFKGIGTINGVGDYGFMISAIDGDLKNQPDPDKFRIKIWESITEEIVYDNQMGADETEDPATQISGGSIVIHDPKTKSAELATSSEITSNSVSDELIVYPNPVSDKLRIQGLNSYTESAVKLVNIAGQTVFSGKSRSDIMEIDMSDFAAGSYGLKIRTNQKISNFKIIKK